MTMPRRFGSVRGIALLYGVLFALVTAGFGLAVYFATQQALAAQVDARLADETSVIIGATRPPSMAAIAARIASRERRRSTSDLAYLLVDNAGRRLTGKLDVTMPPRGYSDVTFGDGVEGGDRGRALTSSLGTSGTLIVVADSEPVEAFDALLVKIFGAAFGAAILAGVLGGAALSRAIRARIEGINRTAQAIIDGDLSRRMPVLGTGGEFDTQSVLLNRMLDRIGELLANLKQVSSDVAHDLRTPLVRLRNRLEEAGGANRSPEAMLAGIHDAVTESDELLDLFGALLRISEIEAGARRAAFAPVDLKALVADQADTFTLVCADEDKRLETGDLVAATILGDRELLAQMLVNCLENAVRHTPPRTVVRVSLSSDGLNVRLTIADNGTGIGDIDPDVLIRRFSRADRSRGSNGHGLGLALVDAIVRLHDGTLTLTNAAQGLCVEIVLPTLTAVES